MVLSELSGPALASAQCSGPRLPRGHSEGGSLHHPGKGRAGPGLRCHTTLAPALGAQAEPDVLGWGHLGLNLVWFCTAPGRDGLTFLPHG